MTAADETRSRLVEAATAVFAEDGVFAGSLVEITRRAGQRNRGAVHYHFGSRESLLVAVLHQHAAFLAAREGELLEQARTHPGRRPRPGPRGDRPPGGRARRDRRRRAASTSSSSASSSRSSTGSTRPSPPSSPPPAGTTSTRCSPQRMPPLDEALHNERLALITGFILRSVADRARAVERSHAGPRAAADGAVRRATWSRMAAGMATRADAIDD